MILSDSSLALKQYTSHAIIQETDARFFLSFDLVREYKKIDKICILRLSY